MKCESEQRGFCLSPSGSLYQSVICQYTGKEEKCRWFSKLEEPEAKKGGS